jgi:protein-S-isoprenylcysteine O-methyltransferase Ste14
MMGKSSRKEGVSPDLKAGIARRVIQVLLTFGFQMTVLLLSAGRFDWLWAWVFVGLYVVGIAANAVFMFRTNPQTIAERSSSQGMKDWDKVVGGTWAVIYFVVLQVVAGLDERFGWTGGLALWVHIAGAGLFILGLGLFSWAMISNAHFSTVVRVQEDQGHAVCTSGPYQFIRHPGYLGAIIQSPAVPLILGSLWALIPGALAAMLMIVRTALEDRTLQEELDGYEEYTHQVRYRLVPGIW